MVIEIFVDNLRHSDIRFNQQFYGIGMLVLREDEILLEYDETELTYTFPRIAYYREAERDLALSSLATRLGMPPETPQATITVCEHFSGRTYNHHYYKVPQSKASVLPPPMGGKKTIWRKLPEALSLLEEYHGSDPRGAQKMTRDFIAMINSV